MSITSNPEAHESTEDFATWEAELIGTELVPYGAEQLISVSLRELGGIACITGDPTSERDDEATINEQDHYKIDSSTDI